MGWADALQGAGAWMSGSGPQYMQAQSQQQAVKAEQEEIRRKAFIQEGLMAESMIKNGRPDMALQLFESRVAAGDKLPPIPGLGGNFDASKSVRDMLRAGDTAGALAQLSTGNQILRDAGLIESENNATDYQASNKTFVNGTTLRNTRSGATEVYDPTGQLVTGEARTKVLQEAQQAEIAMSSGKAGGAADARQQAILDTAATIEMLRAQGANLGASGVGGAPSDADLAKQTQAAKDAQERSTAYLDKVDKVREGFFAIDDAITAIDEGANSGRIADLFPTIRANSLNLENAGRRMGLGVIQSATFGALSEGEMKLAMETALPKLPPAELRVYLTNKKAAQAKYADYLESAAIYLSQPGNTAATWAAEQKALREQQKGGKRGTQAPTGGSTRKIVRRGKDQATGRPVVQYDDGTIEAQ